MDEDIADLRCGYEACVAREEIRRGQGGGLDTEGAEDEEGFFYKMGAWMISMTKYEL